MYKKITIDSVESVAHILSTTYDIQVDPSRYELPFKIFAQLARKKNIELYPSEACEWKSKMIFLPIKKVQKIRFEKD